MLSMILKMSAVTLLYVIATMIMWKWIKKGGQTGFKKVIIGLIYSIFAILSTHFGIEYEGMIVNVRDLAPLAAGLFFSPLSGVIAGVIGGIERYIAGTYFDVGSYTRIACSVSTCLAGFVAWFMNRWIFKGRKPSPPYAFFLGSAMEVFHMYVVFVTHASDMRMAFFVVRTCAIPMITFSGIGLVLMSVVLQVMEHEWKNPFVKVEKEETPISRTFQRILFIVISAVILSIFLLSYALQTRSAIQGRTMLLKQASTQVKNQYMKGSDLSVTDSEVEFGIFNSEGKYIAGTILQSADPDEFAAISQNVGKTYSGRYMGVDSLIYVDNIQGYSYIVTAMSNEEVYLNRDAQAYELALSDILLFTVIYIMIAYLVNTIVVSNINLVNHSLAKITEGDLDEVVEVRNSSEFASLSDDINQTVVALKGYIDAAKKRMEQELEMAAQIQESALPQIFLFPGHEEFELFASMRPAREVGGDFYDFFFLGDKRLVLVIADVSGKGIPAAMFMMRSKTAIRSMAGTIDSPAKILEATNNMLCEGNEADMFVTVWIGIIDLVTGVMKCANAGHEYPAIMRSGKEFEIFDDPHGLVLAALPDVPIPEYEIKLSKNDRLFVYTDGVPEACTAEYKQYGTEMITQTLNTTKDKNMKETLSVMINSVDDFCRGEEQFDDITMLGFEYRGY